MNNYNNPYNQFQYGNRPRNPNYNHNTIFQNNQPNFELNAYNYTDTSRYRWNQNSFQEHWNPSSGQLWDLNLENFNPPVQDHFHIVHENVQSSSSQITFGNQGSTNNQVGTRRNIVTIERTQLFVPKETKKTNEPTSEATIKSKKPSTTEVLKNEAAAKPKCYTPQQAKLLQAFSKPVESSKAERMMQMMGWKGGALGATGEGLVEPIMPNLFQKKRAGFGVPEERKEQPKDTNNVNKLKTEAVTNQPILNETQTYQIHKRKGNTIYTSLAVANKTNVFSKKNKKLVDSNSDHRPVVNKKQFKPKKLKKLKAHPIADVGNFCTFQKLLDNNFADQGGVKPKQFKPKKRKGRRIAEIGDFKIKILNQILYFVNDKTRMEMAFDKNLSKFQRKTVHDLVESIRENDDSKYGNYDNLLEVDLIREILESSDSCDLFTESSGTFPDRQLYLYKGTPEHVFLITQEDLRVLDYDDEDCPDDDDEDCIIIDDKETETAKIPNDKTDDHDMETNDTGEGKSFDLQGTNKDKKEISTLEEKIKLDTLKDNQGAISNDSKEVSIGVEQLLNHEAINIEGENVNTNSGVKSIGVQSLKPGKVEMCTGGENLKQDNIEMCIGDENEKLDDSKDVLTQLSIINDNEEPTESECGNPEVFNVNSEQNNIKNTSAPNEIVKAGTEAIKQNENIVKLKFKNRIGKTPEENSKEELRDLLVEFLKEFSFSETYTVMRFSGDFNKLEKSVIHGFMTDVHKCITNIYNCKNVWKNEENHLEKLFGNYYHSLEVKVYRNADVLITKVPKNGTEELSD